MSALYNIAMADFDMLDTDYLFQPRGQGTGWCFRMMTPAALIGKTNPRTGRPYGREIREGLDTRELKQARKLRDLRLGKIRLEEAQALAEISGSMEHALQYAADLKKVDDPDERELYEEAIEREAERIEKRAGTKKSSRWYKTAMGISTPLKDLFDQYKEDAGKALSLSTVNNFNTARNEFLTYAGEDVALEDVDRRMVADFVTKYLPHKKGPKAPHGQGPATIRKKVSQLG
ncbi:MAG TPA: phage integrase SAM-like domain-containing protein, partial [Magnetospirillum sp.]|nr:phage integrase SAM-like domain-containing protein [Magnetospirillum sp.]